MSSSLCLYYHLYVLNGKKKQNCASCYSTQGYFWHKCYGNHLVHPHPQWWFSSNILSLSLRSKMHIHYCCRAGEAEALDQMSQPRIQGGLQPVCSETLLFVLSPCPCFGSSPCWMPFLPTSLAHVPMALVTHSEPFHKSFYGNNPSRHCCH